MAWLAEALRLLVKCLESRMYKERALELKPRKRAEIKPRGYGMQVGDS